MGTSSPKRSILDPSVVKAPLDALEGRALSSDATAGTAMRLAGEAAEAPSEPLLLRRVWKTPLPTGGPWEASIHANDGVPCEIFNRYNGMIATLAERPEATANAVLMANAYELLGSLEALHGAIKRRLMHHGGQTTLEMDFETLGVAQCLTEKAGDLISKIGDRHTPGPWEVRPGADGVAHTVCCTRSGEVIAELVDRPAAHENAILLAQTPAMLEALRTLHGAIRQTRHGEDWATVAMAFKSQDEADAISRTARDLLDRHDSETRLREIREIVISAGYTIHSTESGSLYALLPDGTEFSDGYGDFCPSTRVLLEASFGSGATEFMDDNGGLYSDWRVLVRDLAHHLARSEDELHAQIGWGSLD